MISPTGEGSYAPQNKNFFKVAFYEWFKKLSEDDHMAAFNILSDIARGRFKNLPVAEAVKRIDEMRNGRPAQSDTYLSEEMKVLDGFIEAEKDAAQNLSGIELRDFTMRHIYGLC